ncbi:hydroxyacylglutathione hydrolase [Halothiobacillus sp. DCM-1]|uniref:hydroxyacylglutathione hydrolase n=1 Tax=Halothiobacillus sp. DCM-1 TaxID=3112558 RepID=UPI0032484D6F
MPQQVHAVPVLSDNLVWLLEGADRRCVVVDLGQAEPVLAALAESRLTPVAVLITHHHADHTAGLAAFLRVYPVPVFGSAHESSPFASQPVADGAVIDLPGFPPLTVWHTPGHTRGHLCFVTEGVAFTGDTLFTAGCGRLFEGSAAQMSRSLARLAALPAPTRICCGHEYTADNLRFAAFLEPDNPAIAERVTQLQTQGAASGLAAAAAPPLSVELATNPFLRLSEPSVLSAIAAHGGQPPLSDAERFALLRRWKDDYDGLAPLPEQTA